MAFESLTDKLQNVFKGLRSKGLLTEEDVKVALKEVKMALLEADVSFKVVKQFIASVQERAVGTIIADVPLSTILIPAEPANVLEFVIAELNELNAL